MTFHPRRLAFESGLYHAGRSLPVMAGGILFFVGGLLTAIGVVAGASERRYRERGRTVDAEVVSRPAAAKGPFAVTVRYRDESIGTDVLRPISFRASAPVPSGPTLRIEYVPGDFESARLPNPGSPLGFAVALGVPALVAASGVYVAMRGFRVVAAARRLARDGTRAEGRVLAVRGSAMTVNNRTQLIVRYRYRDHAGRAHEGDSWPLSPDEGWSEGDTGVVRYDPAQPSRSLWIGREP